MDLDKAIQNRIDTKKYTSKKPDWRDIIEAISSTVYAPMAGKNFALKFIIVNESEKIRKLAEAAQQPFIAEANYLVVVCTDPKRTINLYGDRGKIYCRQQAGAAIQNFLLKLYEAGLATKWVWHFVENQVQGILNIPESINIEAMFPIGFDFEKQKPRLKQDLDNIIYYNKYKNKKINPPRKLDV